MQINNEFLKNYKREQIGGYVYYSFKDDLSLTTLLSYRNLPSLFDIKYIKDNAINYCSTGGRGQSVLFTFGSYKLMLRHYLRGGFVGKFLTDRYFKLSKNAQRAKNEFLLLNYLHQLKLPVPRPLVSRVKKGFIFVKNDILIEQIENTKNLAQILHTRQLNDQECINIGLMLNKFFKVNLVHTDLNIKNILLNNKQEAFLVDFDKCYLVDKLNAKDKHIMLKRLLRSFKKETKLAANGFYFKKKQFELIVKNAIAKN